MLRRILLIAAVAAIGIFCITGCKKSAPKPEPGEQAGQTMPEYEAQAEKEITGDNMAVELDRIEKDLDQDIQAEK